MWIPPLSQLPTEIWERIIDWIGIDSESHQSRYLNKTLCACTLVCRSWLPRAWLNLYRSFEILPKCIPRFLSILRNNPRLSLSSTKSIVIGQQVTGASDRKRLSALFTTTRVTNLKYLEIPYLKLTKEHSVITRGPLSRTVTSLYLWSIHSCSVANLLQFLNSFRSLTDLRLNFRSSNSKSCDYLSYGGQILPRPRPISGRALNSLSLPLILGVDRMIQWYIREGSFLAKLKKLELKWDHGLSQDGNRDRLCSNFDTFTPLLGHCAGVLEDLTIDIHCSIDGGPVIDEIPSAGMF